MPQNLFEPRRPVTRDRVAGISAGPPPPTVDVTVPQPPGAPEPSWLRVYWNTLRSFVRRRLGLGPMTPRTGRRGGSSGRAALVALAVTIVLGLVGAGIVLSGGTGGGSVAGRTAAGSGPAPGAGTATAGSGAADTAPSGVPSPAVRTQVAQWVIADVGPGQLVACDAALCATLSSLGFPTASLVPVDDSAQALQGADVALVTGTLRNRLGAGLTALTATQPLAEFGSGAQAVIVQAVAHMGRAAYDRQLAADLTARRQAGKALLANSHLVFAPTARLVIGQGLVDLRVCAVLAALSSGHTLTVSSFGPAVPGAGPSVPRGGLELGTVDHRPATGDSAGARAVRTLLAAQQPPYRALRTGTAPAADGAPAGLLLTYAQPAPIGVP
ncbi:hypothetical protein [Streptacidiphilus cavernicola]|uniref:Uncharacterized protein n=1 Tax=Streptacidiphilus cavernicola TaxID=3342716 RepID=A0ABV6VQ95_9ACTN